MPISLPVLLALGRAAVSIVLLVAAGLPVSAAPWPQRPVRIITLAGAGGGSDAAARILADALSKRWGRQVIIDNRPGADGIIAVQAFLTAADPTHTLLFSNTGTFAVNPLLHEKLPYEPARDLIPISFVVEDFIAVVASPLLPADSIAALFALARSRPGAINYAAVPGMPYLGFLALEKSAGAEMTFISYRNPIGTVPDLMEGRIDIAVVPLATVLGPIQSGKVKALTVMSPRRATAAPEVLSLAEAGYGDLAFVGGLGLFVRKEMPAEQRLQIEAAVRSAVTEPETAERLATLGYRPSGTTSAEFAALLQSLSMRARAVAQAYGARPSQ